jgi:hypothetical protein
VKVPHGEGLAIHIGPEPCVGTREGVGEASAGEHMGQPWSRESLKVLGADVVRITEGNMDGRVIASARPTRRGLRPWHVWTLFVRESGGLGFGQRSNTAGPHREDEESKPVMHEPEKSDSAIVATKPANKTGQPVAELVERRAGTGRNANQQSTCRAQNRENVSQALGRVRQAATIRCLPPIRLVGAGCLNWARPDLCGGTGVTRFPTAKTKIGALKSGGFSGA